MKKIYAFDFVLIAAGAIINEGRAHTEANTIDEAIDKVPKELSPLITHDGRPTFVKLRLNEILLDVTPTVIIPSGKVLS